MSSRAEPRAVAVLVHGFNSSKACWTSAGVPQHKREVNRTLRFGDLLSTDEAFSEWDIDYFEYDTRFVSLNPFRQIPNIFHLGEQLKTWLRAKQYHHRPTTLIGHSQGGLVVMSYLANVLEEKEAPSLQHVRQVLLIATPLKGSALLLTARSALGKLIHNAQELRLRPLNDSVDELLSRITRDILSADSLRAKDSWPVPVRAFYASSDRIVQKESARGELDPSTLDSLPGDHFSVLHADGPADPRYAALKGAILRPIGHRHILAIEQYSTVISVRPESTTAEVQFKRRQGTIRIGTVCHLSRQVTFSENNICEAPFRIRYRTLAPDGYMKYVSGGARGAGDVSASDLQGYLDEGRQINFRYRPTKGVSDSCFLDLTIYNGFQQGNTKLHFHLAPLDEPLRTIGTLEYQLDLSAYTTSGIDVGEPRLYYYPHNPAVCDDLCGARLERYRLMAEDVNHEPGVFSWKLHNIQGGVVDIVWNIGVPHQPEPRLPS